MSLKTNLLPYAQKAKNSKRLLYIIGAGVSAIILLTVALIVFLFFNKAVKLIKVYPEGEINPKTNLTFYFSGDITDAAKIGKTLAGDFIKFTPDIPGKYRYVSKKELRFLPEVPFLPSTTYKAELKTNLINAKGKYLAGKRVIEFSTHRFKVENVNFSFKYQVEQKKGMQLQARLNFNYPVSPLELQKALKLHLAGIDKEIGYSLNTNEKTTRFTITSEPLFTGEADQKIEISLPAGFRCVDGNLGLEKDYAVTAILGAKKELTVKEVITKTDSARCWIVVRCSEPVEPDKVADFIKLKPEQSFKADVDGEYINIESDRFISGESYDLSLTSGLPALNGYPLAHDFTKTVLFQDLEPSLKFNYTGRYLSSRNSSSLSLETVNIAKVNLEISQISAENIAGYFNSLNGEDYLNESQIASFGKSVKSSEIAIDGSKNVTQSSPVNLEEFVSQKFKGFFQVVAYDNDNRWLQDSKYVIITDLGIAAKMSATELMVWVNSLETLKPKVKVKVTVISKNNQALATGYTDKEGLVRFNQIKKDTAGFGPFVILAEQENDFAFIHLPSSVVSTTNFDIQGRTRLNSEYDAFLYLDRDIFQPGDKANIVAVVRGPNMATPPDTAVKLVIRQDDGQVFKELAGNTRDRGACEFAINIPDYARTGKYYAALQVADKIVGTTVFDVEEFMTERIKLETKTDKEEYTPGETANISIKGLNLFGPPATGKKIDLTVKLEPKPFLPPDSLSSYVFGDPGRKFVPVEEDLGETKLDINGLTNYRYIFPKQAIPPAELKALFKATMVEEGGRAIRNSITATFHPYDFYIGIKHGDDVYGKINKPYRINYVVTDPRGKLTAKSSLLGEIYHITRNVAYRKNPDGRYGFHATEEKEKVFSGVLEATAGENSFQFTPNDYGRFLVVIGDTGGMVRSSLSFNVTGAIDVETSPWATGARVEETGQVKLEPEQEVYRIGDRARIRITAPFPGKALVTVERDKVYDYRIMDFKETTEEIDIPVKAEYQPNVYVSVQLISPAGTLEDAAIALPRGAFGTVPLTIDCSGRKLEVNIESNPEIRPGRQLVVSLKVNKVPDTGSTATYVTLAAVDEEICQINGYITPSPWDYFFGKRGLNVNSYDLNIMNPMEFLDNRDLQDGNGDTDAEGGEQNLTQVSVRGTKPVSLWSGLVKTDREGKAKVKFYIPQFNGALRLMATAFSGNKFGRAWKTVPVRDPIIMTPAFPNFVAPNDQFTVPVSIFNGTGKPGKFALRLFTGGPVDFLSQAELSVELDNNTEKMIYFRLKARNAAGQLIFRLQAKGNDEICEINADLPLRPAAPLTNEIHAGEITTAKPLNLNLEHKLFPETAEYMLILGPLPSVQYSGSLQYLLRYPYDSLEQIAAKIFPLIYFNAPAKALHDAVLKGKNPSSFVNQGIAKLESMQLNDGNFAYWPGGTYSNEWASIFTAHCLIEARKAGFKVTAEKYNKMIIFLQQVAKNNDKEKYHLQTKIYALYVLSLAGKPLMSMMNFVKNYAFGEMGDYSKAQLAEAYYYAGDRKTAQELLPKTYSTGNLNAEGRETGGNFNSPVRAWAIILGAFAEIDPANPVMTELINRLQKEAQTGYWGTTQENAFALIALGKFLEKKRKGNYHGAVIAGNTKIATFSSDKYLTLKDNRLSLGPITVQITGDAVCYYYLKTGGAPNMENTDGQDYDNVIVARKRLLGQRGEPVNLSGIKQGDLLIAELTLQTKQGNLDNIAVEDLLAGGFEIETPRLESSAGLLWLDKNTLNPDYIESARDHLRLFLSIAKPGIYKFYYSLRAVTNGEFVLPQVKAECMYDPRIRSIASGGRVIIGNN